MFALLHVHTDWNRPAVPAVRAVLWQAHNGARSRECRDFVDGTDIYRGVIPGAAFHQQWHPVQVPVRAGGFESIHRWAPVALRCFRAHFFYLTIVPLVTRTLIVQELFF